MKTHTLRLLAVSAIYFSLNPALAADMFGGITAPTSTSVPASRIASRFEGLAGSPENAASLVAGLRNGSAITLDAAIPGQGTSFMPATRPMGYGNITRALSLAQAQLAAQGISHPTPEQLRIALNGGTLVGSGTVRTVDMAGVLHLRSQGMGWGRIAHELALSPGKRPPLAATSSASTTRSTHAGVDLHGTRHGHGAIVSGDGSILHGRTPGYVRAAQGSAQAQTRAADRVSAGAHTQAGRPSITAAASSIGIGNGGKGPLQARGNGRL